jgi:hypothetical protein
MVATVRTRNVVIRATEHKNKGMATDFSDSPEFQMDALGENASAQEAFSKTNFQAVSGRVTSMTRRPRASESKRGPFFLAD